MGWNRYRLSICVGVCMVAMVASTALAEECSFEINKDNYQMVLEGDCTTESTILIPHGYILDGATHRITAVEEFEGGWNGPIVKNEGSRAGVKNLVLATDGLACVCKSDEDRLTGIRLEGAEGFIQDSVILDINKGECGCQEGIGIVASNPPFDGSEEDGYLPVKIIRNAVRRYQKGGIVVQGAVNALVKDNVAEGMGPIDYIGQIGIQMGFGARGRVRSNTTVGHIFLGPSIATGVLVFETDNVIVSRNAVLYGERGIVIAAWGWFAPSADNNQVYQNIVTIADVGVAVSAVSNEFSTQDATANRNRILHNSLVGDVVGSVGILVEEDDCMNRVERTRIKGNIIREFEEPIVVLGDGSEAGSSAAAETKSVERVVPIRP